MQYFREFLQFSLVLLLCSALHAVESRGPLPYTLSTRTVGPITVALDQVPYLTQYNEPCALSYTVRNDSGVPINCDLSFRSTDTIRAFDDKAVDRLVRHVTIAANSSIRGTFHYSAELRTYYNAHYPLIVGTSFTFEGRSYSFETIRVVETDLPAIKKIEPIRIRHGGVSLADKNYEASYKIQGESVVRLGSNWSGRDTKSNATAQFTKIRIGTQMCSALVMHPPYVPKGGSLFLRFPVELPKRDNLILSYECCVPYSIQKNGHSDGVMFRIAACLPDGQKISLDEFHTQSSEWAGRQVDLSSVAGRSCLLELEVNPGPKNNTSFDTVAVKGLVVAARNHIAHSDIRTNTKCYRFTLRDNRTATVEPGANGLLDAKITLSSGRSQVTFSGLRLFVGNCDLNDPLTQFTKPPQIDWDSKSETLSCRYSPLNEDQAFEITVRARVQNGLFLIDIPKGEKSSEIAQIEIGAADKSVKRVYFGHGFVVDCPREQVRIGADGHELSTRHIGVEYEGGPSILAATSFPPNALNIDPKNNICSLEVTGPTTLAFLPSKGTMFGAAIEFRANCPWREKGAPGFDRKAGRLVFDIWGQTATSLNEQLRKIFAYGATDSLFIMHSWQRWGYDIRLPDIWEAGSDTVLNPKVGTLEELRQLNELCASHGVPFALHDNYTDYYPDAEKFSYRYISFMKNGQPQKAWINSGIARSYKWRCDLVKPFLDHNLKLGSKYLPAMDAYFIDVLSSMTISPCYTQDGEFRPRSVNLDAWKDLFRTASRALTHRDPTGKTLPGITVSEAGCDSLIGSLDGADAQWLELRDKRAPGSIFLPCDDWERVPWFAAVNHTNFSRHGAGYSGRYQNVRTRDAHGIYSDDYITSEILGGLDPMVDVHSLYPQAIRKYYLQQHIAKRLAKCEITGFEYDLTEGKEDLHRQTITWSDGTVVRVNRGGDDLNVADFVLPRYSYAVFDMSGNFLSGIFRNPKHQEEVVEAANLPHSFYMNARNNSMTTRHPIEPKLALFEQVGNTAFKVVVDWHAEAPLPMDASVFVHIFQPAEKYSKIGWYAGGEVPALPTSKWGIKTETVDHTVVRTGNNQILNVPKNIPDGKYQILVGLFNAKGDGSRFKLQGNITPGNRYSIGTLEIKREGEKIKFTMSDSEVLSEVAMDDPEARRRATANCKPFTWRGVTTRGALLVTPEQNAWRILPIPIIPQFDVTFDETAIERKIVSVECKGHPVEFKRAGSQVTFPVTAADAVSWRVHFAPKE